MPHVTREEYEEIRLVVIVLHVELITIRMYSTCPSTKQNYVFGPQCIFICA